MSRFAGDGRVKIDPLPEYVREGTLPMRVSRSAARMQTNRFDRDGYSQHSGAGATLWVIIEHCEANGIKYDVVGEKGLGYYVKRKEPPR